MYPNIQLTVQPSESPAVVQPSGERFINVRRLSAHKRRSRCQSEYIYKYGGDKSSHKIAKAVYECGDTLDLLLTGGNTSTNTAPHHHHNPCRKTTLCPLCAIKRAGKAIYTYKAKYEALKAKNPDLKIYYVVLTVKDGPDLAERFAHLEKALKTLFLRRRDAVKAKNGSSKQNYALKSSLAGVEAGAYSIEIGRGAGSGDWHPHANLLLVTREPIYKMKLKAEWKKLTGDSFITYVAAKKDDDKDKAFIEIFKYALKFSVMTFADTWHAYNTLHGKRLFGSFGLFRGLDIDDDCPEPEEDVYCKLLYTYHTPFYNLSHIKYY
jgi:hypothetical protein